MAHLNVEIKARSADPARIRAYLVAQEAVFKGEDRQTDTYFQVPNGRLKLREGNIENNLIFYERDNQAGPKSSHFNLVKIPDAAALKETLDKAIGIKIVVIKRREIYFIDNVKFHIDEVPGLGSFIEIEASDLYAEKTKDELEIQCRYYLDAFGVQPDELIDRSYSDLLLEQW